MTEQELLAAQVELLGRRSPPSRPRTSSLAFSRFTPWWAQRLAGRSQARTVLVVAGRQAGKTLFAAFAVLRRAFERPRSYSALLAPTYLVAEAAIQRILEVGQGLKVRWREQKKRFVLPNRSVIQVFSADRREVVRGPTITGTYWIDEGAYVSETAYSAGRPAMITSKASRTIVTTTPAGKNWVWREFTGEDPETERFRFRSEDSPYTDRDEVQRQRREMTVERAAQEFDAVFVDDLLLAFPHVGRLFVKSFPDRQGEQDLRNVLGVDLGKEQDYVVVTLMNRHGEARILGRWRHVAWPRTQREVEAMARAFDALVVVDSGVGGGSGDVLGDYLTEHGVPVLKVPTAVPREKGRIVEQCRADVQWERVHVLENEFSPQLRHELTLFQMIRRQTVQGREVICYSGPQVRGEHDDCVISLCLANLGRRDGWSQGVEPRENMQEFQDGNLRLAAAMEGQRLRVPLGGGFSYQLGTVIPQELRRWVF